MSVKLVTSSCNKCSATGPWDTQCMCKGHFVCNKKCITNDSHECKCTYKGHSYKVTSSCNKCSATGPWDTQCQCKGHFVCNKKCITDDSHECKCTYKGNSHKANSYNDNSYNGNYYNGNSYQNLVCVQYGNARPLPEQKHMAGSNMDENSNRSCNNCYERGPKNTQCNCEGYVLNVSNMHENPSWFVRKSSAACSV
jgi:hypothetical protein